MYASAKPFSAVPGGVGACGFAALVAAAAIVRVPGSGAVD